MCKSQATVMERQQQQQEQKQLSLPQTVMQGVSG
jgi:hypothetical protein